MTSPGGPTAEGLHAFAPSFSPVSLSVSGYLSTSAPPPILPLAAYPRSRRQRSAGAVPHLTVSACRGAWLPHAPSPHPYPLPRLLQLLPL